MSNRGENICYKARSIIDTRHVHECIVCYVVQYAGDRISDLLKKRRS